MLFSLQIPVVKRIAAFRAELGRVCRVSRLPAAFVAFVLRNTGRFWFAAFSAKLSFVHRTAATRPAVCLRFRLFGAAFRAEFSACRRAALRAFPASCRRLGFRLFAAAVRAEFSGNTALSTRTVPSFSSCRSRSRLRCLLLCAHLIEILRVHAARLTCHVHAHKRHCRACTLIRRRRLHRGSLPLSSDP